jgi:hypothetical protein
MYRKPLDKEKLHRCVNKLVADLHLLDRNSQQWLLYNIDRHKWPKWDGTKRIPLQNDESEPQKYVSNYVKDVCEEDRQRLLERITELNLVLDYNLVVCNRCATILESTYGHDFKVCPCGSGVFVDGGREPGFGRMCLGTDGAKHFTTYEEAKKYQEFIQNAINTHREVDSLLTSLGIPQRFHRLFTNDYTAESGSCTLYCRSTAVKETQIAIASGELKLPDTIIVKYTPRSPRKLAY